MDRYQHSTRSSSAKELPSISTFLPISDTPDASYEPQYFTGVGMDSLQNFPEIHGTFACNYTNVPPIYQPPQASLYSELQSHSRLDYHQFYGMTPTPTLLHPVPRDKNQKPSEDGGLEAFGTGLQISLVTEMKQAVNQQNGLAALPQVVRRTPFCGTVNAEVEPFPALSIHVQSMKHPVLLYNAPHTNLCYSFCYLEQKNSNSIVYYCKGCFEKTKQRITMRVNGTCFQLNPALLPHVCEPKVLMEEISYYTGREVKLPLKKYLIVSKVQPGTTRQTRKCGNTDSKDTGNCSHQNRGPSKSLWFSSSSSYKRRTLSCTANFKLTDKRVTRSKAGHPS